MGDLISRRVMRVVRPAQVGSHTIVNQRTPLLLRYLRLPTFRSTLFPSIGVRVFARREEGVRGEGEEVVRFHVRRGVSLFSPPRHDKASASKTESIYPWRADQLIKAWVGHG